MSALTTLDEWAIRRGASGRPTLWACSHCGYSFWSFGPEQDPEGDGHCSDGYWKADREALGIVPAHREYWMAP